MERKHRPKIDFWAGILLAGTFTAAMCSAQGPDEAWLRYQGHSGRTLIPEHVRALGHGALEQSAVEELKRSITYFSSALSVRAREGVGGEVVVGTADEIEKAFPEANAPADLAADGYWLHIDRSTGGQLRALIAGGDERGVLYGAFALLRGERTGKASDVRSSPAMPIRWVDEWNNPDGSIEHGYGGRSIFFEGGHVRSDLSLVTAYARLLASVGIDGCNLNNVNAAPQLLEDEHLKEIARVADAMRPWGVRLSMSVALTSPEKIGGLKTSDPLDPAVQAWWSERVSQIYALIPDFAGFTVKADSEGQAGPSKYGRNPADAANMLAHALEPHGGIVLYRAFVYNNHLDYNDLKADRARAAYDIFHPLDGKFAPNVIVQTKEGPIDFQAREPVSPLFAGLEKTSQAMELQIVQEYLGQERHLVYIAPMWKQVLDFDMRARNQATPVKQIIEGKTFHQPMGGMVGVSNVGRDSWLGSPLAMANLYAFGRLAWNPDLSAEDIAREWVQQTISSKPHVVAVVSDMLMQSWPAYEHYTGPLGAQTLTDITGSHYGPNVEASERNGWGQWHRDDAQGIGMDRSVATGTGFAGQYPAEIARAYESPATTPDNLLLFFHHVPYTYKLHSGETVIQYIYDSHYRGAAEAARLGEEWASLKGEVDDALFTDVQQRLAYQAGHAIVWRDAIVQYFLKQSGIPDTHGRAGHYPGRLEAEDGRLSGYTAVDVTPWEDASAGRAVTCGQVAVCSAEWTWNGATGVFDVAVQYFDLQGGAANFKLLVNGAQVAKWTGNDTLPSRRPNGDNSTRKIVSNVRLQAGDQIRVEGAADGLDPAALDYVEISPVAKTGVRAH